MSLVEASSNVVIAVLAKAPVPGLAKTRLIPDLGADRAADLQRQLLHMSVANAVKADIGPVNLWCTPDVLHPEFQRYADSPVVTLHQQVEGDLGERLFAASRGSLASDGVLLIGTDCPVLDAETLRLAAKTLQSGSDAVMIPAEDGGYVLIGMKAVSPHPFTHIDWSTDQVAQQTRSRFAELGWDCSELATLWDVDYFKDYQRLCALIPRLL